MSEGEGFLLLLLYNDSFRANLTLTNCYPFLILLNRSYQPTQTSKLNSNMLKILLKHFLNSHLKYQVILFKNIFKKIIINKNINHNV